MSIYRGGKYLKKYKMYKIIICSTLSLSTHVLAFLFVTLFPEEIFQELFSNPAYYIIMIVWGLVFAAISCSSLLGSVLIYKRVDNYWEKLMGANYKKIFDKKIHRYFNIWVAIWLCTVNLAIGIYIIFMSYRLIFHYVLFPFFLLGMIIALYYTAVKIWTKSGPA